MFRFEAIFAFVGSFCRFKILGRVFDHNRDTIGLFSLTHLCGKLCCVWQWIIHIMYSVPFEKRLRYTAPYGLHFHAAFDLITGTSLCTYAVEPPCTERYARWCERSGLIQPLLLDWESLASKSDVYQSACSRLLLLHKQTSQRFYHPASMCQVRLPASCTRCLIKPLFLIRSYWQGNYSQSTEPASHR